MEITQEIVIKRIRELIEWRNGLPSISERTPLISSILYDEFFFNKDGDTQDKLKRSLVQVLNHYSNINGPNADAVIAQTLYLCLRVSVSLSDRLIELLQNGNLKGRNYEGKDLSLLALNVLADLPAGDVDERALLGLYSELENYLDHVRCNYFLDVFANHNVYDGIRKILDRLLRIQLNQEQADDVGRQFYISFEQIRTPSIIGNWLLQEMAFPNQIAGNWINESFLQLVDIARKEPEYYSERWLETFYVIKAFSPIYSPKKTKVDALLAVDYETNIDILQRDFTSQLNGNLGMAIKNIPQKYHLDPAIKNSVMIFVGPERGRAAVA